MKDKRLAIVINRSAKDVFDFVLNPHNTPLWIDAIVQEQTNEFPVKKGTMYRNQNKEGKWSEYTVIEFEKDRMFVLKNNNNNYSVRYTLKPVDENKTELDYYEWVNQGELDDFFTIKLLEKLKGALEN